MTDLTYAEYVPTPALAPFVRCLWTLSASAGAVGEPQPIVPDGCVELIFHVGDSFRRRDPDGRWVVQPRAILVGAVTGPTIVEPTGSADVVGIRLHPWSGRAFLGLPLNELGSDLLSLGDVASGLSRTLGHLLEDTADETERLSRLVGALEAHVERRPLPDPAVRAVIERMTSATDLPAVAQVASALGRSTRWVQRAFSETLGFGPKMLSRIARVQRALKLARRDPGAGWSAIAVDAGYFDHSHLVRDFKQLVGCTPSEFDPRDMPITDAFVEA
jgi:AraC-like DNA-binding protein